jgi:hypothetical protein
VSQVEGDLYNSEKKGAASPVITDLEFALEVAFENFSYQCFSRCQNKFIFISLLDFTDFASI